MPPGRRSRRPKTRSGCRRCRERRVKCDELVPSCMNCITYGCICPGYELTVISYHGGSPHSRTPTNSPGHEITASWLSSLTNAERSSFDFYLNSVAPAFDSSFNSSLWSRHVPQVAAETPALLYAVLALSYAYQARSAPALLDVESFTGDTYAGALAQHERAVRVLRDFIDRSDSTGDIEDDQLDIILMSTLMLISFRLLQGERSYATSHFSAMTRILQQQRSSSPTPSHKLHQVAMIYGQMHSGTPYFRLQLLPRWELQQFRPRMPTTFRSFYEARHYLDSISTVFYQIRDEICRQAVSTTPHRQGFEKARGTVRQSIYELCAAHTVDISCSLLSSDLADLKISLGEWNAKYKQIAAGNESPQEMGRLGIKLLRFKHKLLTCCSTGPEVYDNLYADYKTALNIATKYTALGAARLSPVDRAMVAGPEVSTAVYGVGLQSRDPSLRRQALDFLKGVPPTSSSSPTNYYAPALKRIIMIEEDAALVAMARRGVRCPEINQAEDIPEEARILEVQLVGSPSEGDYARLLCARLDTLGCVDVFEEIIRADFP